MSFNVGSVMYSTRVPPEAGAAAVEAGALEPDCAAGFWPQATPKAVRAMVARIKYRLDMRFSPTQKEMNGRADIRAATACSNAQLRRVASISSGVQGTAFF